MTQLTDVAVDEDEGELVVTWEFDHGEAAVQIAIGPRPDAIDHQHVATVGADHRMVRIPDPGPGRHFVSVSVDGHGGGMIAAERRLRLEGLQNFRDLGGYPVASGGRTRWGRLYRADALHKLTANDLEVFASLGVQTVYDLRGDSELAEMPNPMEAVNLQLLSDARLAVEAVGVLSPLDGEAMLRDIYVGILANCGHLFARLFNGLASPDGTPAVFHCHAGKDRTGVTGALVLLALGVPREVVLDDFELTARYRLRVHQEGSFAKLLLRGITPEAAGGLLGAPRWAMAETLDVLDARYGGIEGYLRDEAELESSTIDALRAALTG